MAKKNLFFELLFSSKCYLLPGCLLLCFLLLRCQVICIWLVLRKEKKNSEVHDRIMSVLWFFIFKNLIQPRLSKKNFSLSHTNEKSKKV